MMQWVRKYGVVIVALWDCSSKTDEFRRFTGTIRVNRASSLNKVRVSVRITISLVLVIGWG